MPFRRRGSDQSKFPVSQQTMVQTIVPEHAADDRPPDYGPEHQKFN
jgi:hypothetical protein